MKLFKYEGYKLEISEEAMLLKPFKKIVNRDRSQKKETAMMELGFIYFMCDPRSDYQYLTDEEERAAAIKLGEGFPEDWKPDKLIEEAMNFYKEFKSDAILLLEDTKAVIFKLRTQLKELDLTATDDKGKPLYPLNQVTQTIRQLPELAKAVSDAERAINEELKNQSRMRGGQEKTVMEDGVLV